MPQPRCRPPRSPVSETERYALLILIASLAALASVLLNRLTEKSRCRRRCSCSVVVVVFSVLLQGGSFPRRYDCYACPPEPSNRNVGPWRPAAGRARRRAPSPRRSRGAADGTTIAQVAEEVGDMWVSVVVRERALLAVRDDTRLEAGDEVVSSPTPSCTRSSRRPSRRPEDRTDGRLPAKLTGSGVVATLTIRRHLPLRGDRHRLEPSSPAVRRASGR